MDMQVLLCSVLQFSLILIRYSAKPPLRYHALVWMVGFRMAGFVLSMEVEGKSMVVTWEYGVSRVVESVHQHFSFVIQT